MKTKTIEVWVDKVDVKRNTIRTLYTKEFVKHHHDEFFKNHSKVTLTYEIEEPKIEITPSQLKKAMDKHGYFIESFNELSRELFGELDD